MSLDLIVSNCSTNKWAKGFAPQGSQSMCYLPMSHFLSIVLGVSGHRARDKPSRTYPLIVQTHGAPISWITRLYLRRYTGRMYPRKRMCMCQCLPGHQYLRARLCLSALGQCLCLAGSRSSFACPCKLSQAFASPYFRLASPIQQIFFLTACTIIALSPQPGTALAPRNQYLFHERNLKICDFHG